MKFCSNMPQFCIKSAGKTDFVVAALHIRLSDVEFSGDDISSQIGVTCTSLSCRKWKLHSTTNTNNFPLQALSTFNFSIEKEDKILGKAFGLVHSPYWGEDRNKEVPEYDVVMLLKKFPEVLGCSLEDEIKNNAQVLEKQWGIKGKSLRNLLPRNPKVSGFNIDCKGDCMAQCPRCWVRF
ncbi:hypothetical protein DCAR_0831040 [Daucus carota subsp. sativus]|uniref:Uncharacterized protein n=1 Tax=Daucus carota subsp. sativus TaxID=79200 RepID=A0AAF0XRZ5_DAUCS|nr:hypothetical protein DCAR_0831040 [Daucus carota subsp. sativus]